MITLSAKNSIYTCLNVLIKMKQIDILNYLQLLELYWALRTINTDDYKIDILLFYFLTFCSKYLYWEEQDCFVCGFCVVHSPSMVSTESIWSGIASQCIISVMDYGWIQQSTDQTWLRAAFEWDDIWAVWFHITKEHLNKRPGLIFFF